MRRTAFLPALLLALSSCLAQQQADPIDSTLALAEVLYMQPDEALSRLKEGNLRFVAGKPLARDWKAQMVAAAKANQPFAAVWTTDESRLPLPVAFDAGVGEIQTLRTPGLDTSDAAIGSLSLGVAAGTKVIVILGHSNCAAVDNARQGLPQPHLAAATEAIRQALAEASTRTGDPFVDGLGACDAATVAYVRAIARELPSKSETISMRVADGQLKIVPAFYDLETGAVVWL